MKLIMLLMPLLLLAVACGQGSPPESARQGADVPSAQVEPSAGVRTYADCWALGMKGRWGTPNTVGYNGSRQDRRTFLMLRCQRLLPDEVYGSRSVPVDGPAPGAYVAKVDDEESPGHWAVLESNYSLEAHADCLDAYMDWFQAEYETESVTYPAMFAEAVCAASVPMR